MALSDLQKLKLEIGLSHLESGEILTDIELQYFIDKNNGSIRRAGLDAAKTMLFILSQYVHERSGVELELWNHDWFNNYMKALKMYINDPNYSIAVSGANGYAGGISKQDIRDNLNNTDVNPVSPPDKTPTDYSAAGEEDVFKRDPYRTNPYNL